MGVRAYRVLLRLLPRPFRDRWGRDMEDLFAHRLSRAKGSVPRMGWVWVRGLTDVLAHAVRERMPRSGGERGDGMKTWGKDLSDAWRSLRRSPGLAALACVTLALGIGAATGTFSVVHAVLLRDLPYERPDELVTVWPEVNGNMAMVGLADEGMASLQGTSGISRWLLTVTDVGDPREISGTVVSTGHFDVLGVSAILGRTFRPEDGLPGNAGVVILSHDFWSSAFGADPGAIGRVVDISGAEYDRRSVIGVMPPGFRPVMGDTDVWIPLEGDPSVALEDDNSWYVNYRIARLAPGFSLEQANEEVKLHARDVQARVPRIFDAEDASTATVQPLGTFIAGETGPPIRVALGAVSLVLLIACGNVANLLLARGEARAQALSVRVALGASRLRLARMLMAESLVLALAGGALGVGLSFALVQLLVALAPEGFPRISEVGVSTPVLLYALAVTLAAAVLAGTGPALRSSRPGSTAALSGAGRGAARTSTSGLSRSLVVVQVALAMVVAVGSGLMLRSFARLLAEDPGLDGRQVLTFRPNPPGSRYATGADYARFYDQVMERVAAVPGVVSVGAIHLLPGTSDNWAFPTYTGEDLPEGAAVPNVNFRAVRPGYFATLRIPLRRGRLITAADGPDDERVALVNQAFVDRFWSGEDPLTRSVRMFEPTADPYRVVGVVGDVRQHDRDSAPRPEMYFAHSQVPWDQMSMWVMARVQGGAPLDYADPIRAAVWEVDPAVPIAGMDDMALVLERSTRMTRFLATVLTGFGVLAVVLGGVGIFGVTAYTVGRRMPEFGVRLTMGATRRGLLWIALARSVLPVAVGIGIGVVGALLTTGLLESVLYGVQATDAATFASVGAVLAAVALVAVVFPAWRASRVDPVSMLSSD